MAESTLAQRIKAELDATAQRVAHSEEARARAAHAREEGMVKFNEVCEELKPLFNARLEDFAKAFGEKVKITPTITPAERAVSVAFLTDLANITLTLGVVPDPEVTKFVVIYDLLILPTYFEYERRSRLEMPLDKIDRDAIGRWVDDRIIACVKAYVTVCENEYYLRRVKVEAPTAMSASPPKGPRR
jgi:hypothetical protein